MSLIFHNLSDKIRRDQRGWVVNPFEGLPDFPAEFGHLHLGTIEPGAVRGNHLHTEAVEWIFIFGGEYAVHWEEGGEFREKRVGTEESLVIQISPGAAHAVRNDSNHTIHFITYQNESLQDTLNTTRRKEIL